jgi:hypothetical protein
MEKMFMAQPDDMFGDDDYPAYTMGRAADADRLVQGGELV